MKKLIAIAFISIIAISCNKKEDEAENQTFQIGQEHKGGIVFMLDVDKEHGVVVAKTDQVTSAMHINYNDSKALIAAYNEGGEGWRLPTKDELEVLYDVHVSVGISGFESNRNYWSSTESTQGTSAWTKYWGVHLGFIVPSPWTQFTSCINCSRAVKSF